MNRNITELKRIARGNLTFRYKIPVLAVLFSHLLTIVITTPFSDNYAASTSFVSTIVFLLSSLFISLLTSLLVYGQVNVHLKLARLSEPQMGDIFVFFKNQPDRYILGTLISFFIILAAALPFYIVSLLINFFFYNLESVRIAADIALLIFAVLACIYEAIKLSLFPFFLVDRQDMSLMECFFASREKANNEIGRLIKTTLSFIGYLLLSVLSLGLGFLWTVPYLFQTLTVLYLDITGELSGIEYKKVLPKGAQGAQ